MRRLAVVVALALGLFLFIHFDLHRYLSFAALKAGHAQLAASYQRTPVAFIAGFVALEILGLALCLPGVVLTMALAGGALFGLGPGTIIVLSAMTIGDSLGFLAARYLVGDLVRPWLHVHLERIESEVERNGAFYLLSLRLMAAIPYFVINLAFGLTRMRLLTFAPISFIGLAPATVLYVNAGTQLSRLERPSDALSPGLLATFALLAVVPLAARWWFGGRAR
jgi:uncharacterized membrane protein YdjX (TVP38/TMEM64 family)